MTVKKVGSVNSAATGGTVKAVRQADTTLMLDFESGSNMDITTAEATPIGDGTGQEPCDGVRALTDGASKRRYGWQSLPTLVSHTTRKARQTITFPCLFSNLITIRTPNPMSLLASRMLRDLFEELQ